LAERLTGAGLTAQPIPDLAPLIDAGGALKYYNASLNGVSCPSKSFCVAVGVADVNTADSSGDEIPIAARYS
jgi:hypothetical protein